MDELPRIHANGIHIATGPYDVTLTFLETDPTMLPEDQEGPHGPPTPQAQAQIVLSYGAAKVMLPALVKMIADYETRFGEIPAPGFEQFSKE